MLYRMLYHARRLPDKNPMEHLKGHGRMLAPEPWTQWLPRIQQWLIEDELDEWRGGRAHLLYKGNGICFDLVCLRSDPCLVGWRSHCEPKGAWSVGSLGSCIRNEYNLGKFSESDGLAVFVYDIRDAELDGTFQREGVDGAEDVVPEMGLSFKQFFWAYSVPRYHCCIKASWLSIVRQLREISNLYILGDI